MKTRGWLLLVVGLLWGPAVGADTVQVTEIWRSPFGRPRSVSVNATDSTCWAAIGSGATHFAADGSVLSRTTDIGHPDAICADAGDGSYWVADTEKRLVVHIDRDGRELWRGTDFLGPVSLAVNPTDGSCWVADSTAWQSTAPTGAVVHLAADGSELSSDSDFVAPTSVSVNATDSSCWVADEGWASLSYANGSVTHLNSHGAVLWRGSSFRGARAVSANSADGSCWVANTQDSEVIRLSSSGAELLRTSNPSGLYPFTAPYSVSVNPGSGVCWVTDVSGSGYRLVTITQPDPGGDPGDWSVTYVSEKLTEPVAVSANAADGSAWVADRSDAQVIHISADLQELLRAGDWCWPTSVAAAADGSCWAADAEMSGSTGAEFAPGWYLNSAVAHVARNGTELWRGSAFRNPGSVSTNLSDASCWVADTDDNQVVYLLESGEEEWRGGGFDLPRAVSANAADGSCWVADTQSDAVAHLSASGTELWRGSAFSSPQSVSVNRSSGSCWVADTYHDELVHLSASGTELWRSSAFAWPASVSVDQSDGSCWVADANHDQVVRVSASHEELWRGGGFASPQSVSANRSDGSCWVADTDHDQVVCLSSSGEELWRGGTFAGPSSVSVDATRDSCWVADTENGQLVRLDITEDAPVAEFSATPLSGAAPLTVTFTDESTGGPTSWSWSFGDGGTSAARNPTHTYSEVDSYTVSLTASNAYGSDTETKSHYVRARSTWNLAAGFTATPVAGLAPLTVAFTDTSEGDPTSWVWDFGDGSSSTRQSPLHTYTPSGVYSVVLRVSDGSDSGTRTRTNYITVTSPGVDFAGRPAVGVAPLTVTFTDLSTTNPSSWLWDFGDGGTSTLQAPSHTYEAVGAYRVSLTAAGGGGAQTKVRPGYILVTFPDVPDGQWALRQVLACVNAGIVQGYPDGSYRPTQAVTRDQMAVYISRALAGGDDGVNVPTGVTEPTFGDVGEDYWAYRYIEYCAGEGVVQGYPDGTYRPSDTVTRGQMAVYIARAVAGGDAHIPSGPETPTFSDVTADNDWAWCYPHVEYCAAEGIVQGYADNTYRPANAVTRDQMAVYVARAFALPL
jgi:PKD repeat protein